MDIRNLSGYEEIHHTADWALRVWAEDFPGLLAQAAEGMNILMGVRLADTPRTVEVVHIKALDDESLLVSFLNDLLFQIETNGRAFDRYHLQINPPYLSGRIEGAPVARIEKQIKAVTFHNLTIRTTKTGLETVIVFDV